MTIESRSQSAIKPLSAQISIHNQNTETKEVLGGAGLFNYNSRYGNGSGSPSKMAKPSYFSKPIDTESDN